MKIRDQWGLVKEMVHPQRMQKVVIRLDGPLQSVQPYKQLCSGHNNELSAQFKPSPKTIKRKKDHTCKHVLVPFNDMSCRAPYSLLNHVEKGDCCRGVPAMQAATKW